MTSKAAIFALLSLWGVGATVCLPANAQETNAPTESALEDDDADFTNRVWVKAGDEASRPGVIKIFLSDGTLVQDSCWETHRLSAWHAEEDMSLNWEEDGMPIKAEAVTLNAEELVLSLKLIGGDVEERYTLATVPYVCPDIPKS
jgi:hypothetical protein